MDLRDLRLLLTRHWLLALVAFQVCFVLGLVASFVPDDEYAATATVYVEINSDGGAQSVQQATFQLPGVTERLKSRGLYERTTPDLAPEYQNVRVKVSVASTASLLTVRGESVDAAAAAARVNALVNRAIEEQPPDGSLLLSVIDVAVPRQKPFAPNPRPIMLMAVVAGVIVALLTVVLAARIRESFDTHQAVRDRLGTTVLGEVPRLRHLRRRSVLDLLEDNEPDLVEAFQALRANVEFRMSQFDVDIVAVTSHSPASGKSTVTAGLGWSLAVVGREVCLIDADLRHPTMHDCLGESVGRGLGEMAAAGDEFPAVQPTRVQGLDFVSAGIPAGRPADVVTVALPRAISAVSTSHQPVIIDAPPLAGVAETSLIVSAATWVILVVDSSASELEHLSSAVGRINESGGKLLGVVFNRVPRRRFRRTYYSYDRPVRKRQTSRRSIRMDVDRPETELQLTDAPTSRH